MRGIINRRASKKVTSYFRDNRQLNQILESKKEIEKIMDENRSKVMNENMSEDKGGK